jgi:hypothetical protein
MFWSLLVIGLSDTGAKPAAELGGNRETHSSVDE